MKQAAIDASVVIARLLGEPRPSWVDELVADVGSGRTTLIAPSLLWLEVGNRLARSRNITDERALEGMLRTDALGIQPVEVGPPLRLRALLLAREHGLTIYDATYLAVAEAAKAPLVTLDRHLERIAAAIGLGRTGGISRVSEPAAQYGHDEVDITSLATIGAALAELRRQYEPA